jgi:hypothetical protein
MTDDQVPPNTSADIDFESGVVTGDAGTYLEELVFEEVVAFERGEPDGLLIQLVGPHLRLAGTLQIGYHRRLSDFINHHIGLMKLHDARVLRRNGDPTKVTAASIWVSPDEVTLIGQETELEAIEADPAFVTPKRTAQLIVVTPGHTITGEVHLNLEANLSAFIESSDPTWVPMTDVRTRSLADRRVISRYGFALLNRRHVVAATELQPGMIRGRAVL